MIIIIMYRLSSLTVNQQIHTCGEFDIDMWVRCYFMHQEAVFRKYMKLETLVHVRKCCCFLIKW